LAGTTRRPFIGRIHDFGEFDPRNIRAKRAVFKSSSSSMLMPGDRSQASNLSECGRRDLLRGVVTDD
jgi:hypothetical protein